MPEKVLYEDVEKRLDQAYSGVKELALTLQKDPELMTDVLLQSSEYIAGAREACFHLIETAVHLFYMDILQSPPYVNRDFYAFLLRLLEVSL